MRIDIPHHNNHNLRLNFLDGLRGWAAIMVLLSHIITMFLAKTTPSYQSNYLAFITDGHLAVFIFFVLSGFALSVKFIIRPNSSIAHAVVSRYFRLGIPILFTSLIAYFLIIKNLMFNTEAGIAAQSPQWLGSFYNFQATIKSFFTFCFYDVFFRYRKDFSYNSSLWTMPIEFGGSMLIYAVIAIFKRHTQKMYIIPLLSITIYYFFHNPAICCFMFGYILAEIYFKIKVLSSKTIHVTATLLFFIPIILSTFNRPFADSQTALLALILVFSVTFSPLLQTVFSSSISKFLGKISFPLYLIHIIIICSVSSYLFITLPLYGYNPQASAHINLFITITLSIFFAWFISPIEKFSLRVSKIISKKVMKVST